MWREDRQHLVGDELPMPKHRSDAMTAVGFKGDKETTVEGRLTRTLMVSVVASLCGMFTFGYNTGVINSPKNDIKKFIKAVYVTRYGPPANEEEAEVQAESLFSYIVAAFALGGLVSGPVAGWLSEGRGRKGGLLLVSAVGVVASLLLGFARLADSHEMLLVGRFLIGACSGLFTSLSPMYISEVAPLSMRGALGVCNQLSVTIALLVAQLLGADFGLKRWDVLLGISAVPCVLLLVLLPFCPESPRFLLAAGRLDAAENALSWLRAAPGAHVRAEVQAMKDEEQGAEPAMGFLQLVRSSSLRKPLLVAVVLQLSQQLSGINGVLYYSTDVFTKAGLDDATSKLATVGTGGIMVLMTLVSTQFVDRLGRRALLLLGLGGMFVSSLAVTATLGLASEGAVVRALAVVSVLAFVVLFSLGPGSIPWLITAELFSQGPRPAAVACSVTVNWAANLLVSLAFPPMQAALGYLVFAPFSVLLFFFSLFTAFRVPETKNKTFREIADSFR